MVCTRLRALCVEFIFVVGIVSLVDIEGVNAGVLDRSGINFYVYFGVTAPKGLDLAATTASERSSSVRDLRMLSIRPRYFRSN